MGPQTSTKQQDASPLAPVQLAFSSLGLCKHSAGRQLFLSISSPCTTSTRSLALSLSELCGADSGRAAVSLKEYCIMSSGLGTAWQPVTNQQRATIPQVISLVSLTLPTKEGSSSACMLIIGGVQARCKAPTHFSASRPCTTSTCSLAFRAA
eukprot:scaffold65025_cov39-Tisochrysis_lutea.AAC.1